MNQAKATFQDFPAGRLSRNFMSRVRFFSRNGLSFTSQLFVLEYNDFMYLSLDIVSSMLAWFTAMERIPTSRTEDKKTIHALLEHCPNPSSLGGYFGQFTFMTGDMITLKTTLF
jgi:hypothetical protein